MTAHELMAAASLHYGFHIGSYKGDDRDLFAEIGRAWAEEFTKVSDQPDFTLSDLSEGAAREVLAWVPTDGTIGDWIDLFPRNVLHIAGARTL